MQRHYNEHFDIDINIHLHADPAVSLGPSVFEKDKYKNQKEIFPLIQDHNTSLIFSLLSLSPHLLIPLPAFTLLTPHIQKQSEPVFSHVWCFRNVTLMS